MNVTGHLAIGAASYLFAAKTLPNYPVFADANPATWFLGLVLCLFGSLLPDIDHPQSSVGSKVKFISYPLSLVFGHRGITHSLLAIALIVWGLYELLYIQSQSFYVYLAAPVLLGYLSHVIIDAFSPARVRLMYPSQKRYGLALYDGALSQLLVYVSILSLSVWYYFAF